MHRVVRTADDVSAAGARRFVERFSRLLARLGSKDRSLTVRAPRPFLARILCLPVAALCSVNPNAYLKA